MTKRKLQYGDLCKIRTSHPNEWAHKRFCVYMGTWREFCQVRINKHLIILVKRKDLLPMSYK